MQEDQTDTAGMHTFWGGYSEEEVILECKGRAHFTCQCQCDRAGGVAGRQVAQLSLRMPATNPKQGIQACCSMSLDMPIWAMSYVDEWAHLRQIVQACGDLALSSAQLF